MGVQGGAERRHHGQRHPEIYRRTGVKTLGYIGVSDAYGEGYYKVLSEVAPRLGITLSGHEVYARSDASVTGQVLKVLAGKPDAVFIASAGTRRCCRRRRCASAVTGARSSRPMASPPRNSSSSRQGCRWRDLHRRGLHRRQRPAGRQSVRKTTAHFVDAYKAPTGPFRRFSAPISTTRCRWSSMRFRRR